MSPSPLFLDSPADPLAATPGDREAEIRELVWQAIDGQADELAISRLQNLVLTQREARKAFCDVVRIEQDLRCVYSGH